MDNKISEPFDLEAFQQRLNGLRLPRESVRAFAIRAGVSDTVMRKYLTKDSEPSLRMTARIAKCLGIDLNVLAYGDGGTSPVVIDDVPSQEVNESVTAPYLFQAEFELIDSYQVFASAGHGQFVSDEQKAEPMAFRAEWLKREGLNADRLAVIRAKGDSMEPTISDNDVILLHLANGEAPRDGLHVIRMEGGLFVKRLQFSPLGSVKVVSDNPSYQSWEFTKEQRSELHVVGRVVWAGKKF